MDMRLPWIWMDMNRHGHVLRMGYGLTPKKPNFDTEKYEIRSQPLELEENPRLATLNAIPVILLLSWQ